MVYEIISLMLVVTGVMISKRADLSMSNNCDVRIKGQFSISRKIEMHLFECSTDSGSF